MGGTMRLGLYPAKLAEGSQVAEAYGVPYVDERHRHRYEVANAYRAAARGGRPPVLRHLARRPARGVRRAARRRAPVLRRHPGAPRVPVASHARASAVRRADRRGARRLGAAARGARAGMTGHEEWTGPVEDAGEPRPFRDRAVRFEGRVWSVVSDTVDFDGVVRRARRHPASRRGRGHRPRRRRPRPAHPPVPPSRRPVAVRAARRPARRARRGRLADGGPRAGRGGGVRGDPLGRPARLLHVPGRHVRGDPGVPRARPGPAGRTAVRTPARRRRRTCPAPGSTSTRRATWCSPGSSGSPSAVAGILAAWASRAGGWASLRPVDAPWPARDLLVAADRVRLPRRTGA